MSCWINERHFFSIIHTQQVTIGSIWGHTRDYTRHYHTQKRVLITFYLVKTSQYTNLPYWPPLDRSEFSSSKKKILLFSVGSSSLATIIF